jgi:hypothetical protein
MSKDLIPKELIENKIYIIRGHKVMLDSDLAMLYDVETKRINEAVKRNIERFPENFMFEITNEEWLPLRSQFATSMEAKGGRRYSPRVFTEHGVLMLSNVLNSKRAIAVSIQIVNTFVRLREIAAANKEVFQRFSELEQRFITYMQENTQELTEQEQKINDEDSEKIFFPNLLMSSVKAITPAPRRRCCLSPFEGRVRKNQIFPKNYDFSVPSHLKTTSIFARCNKTR